MPRAPSPSRSPRPALQGHVLGLRRRAHQFALFRNGALVHGSIYGSGAGTQPNTGQVDRHHRRRRRAHAENHSSRRGGRAPDARRWHAGERERVTLDRKARARALTHCRLFHMNPRAGKHRFRLPATRASAAASASAPRRQCPRRGEPRTQPLVAGAPTRPRRSSTPRRWSGRSSAAASRSAASARDVSCPSGVHQKKGWSSPAPPSSRATAPGSSSPSSTAPAACTTRRADGGGREDLGPSSSRAPWRSPIAAAGRRRRHRRPAGGARRRPDTGARGAAEAPRGAATRPSRPSTHVTLPAWAPITGGRPSCRSSATPRARRRRAGCG